MRQTPECHFLRSTTEDIQKASVRSGVIGGANRRTRGVRCEKNQNKILWRLVLCVKRFMGSDYLLNYMYVRSFTCIPEDVEEGRSSINLEITR